MEQIKKNLLGHLVGNKLDLDEARERIVDFDQQIDAMIDAGDTYIEEGVAGELVEAIAIFWADLCLAGMWDATHPYSLYSIVTTPKEVG